MKVVLVIILSSVFSVSACTISKLPPMLEEVGDFKQWHVFLCGDLIWINLIKQRRLIRLLLCYFVSRTIAGISFSLRNRSVLTDLIPVLLPHESWLCWNFLLLAPSLPRDRATVDVGCKRMYVKNVCKTLFKHTSSLASTTKAGFNEGRHTKI